MNNKEVVKDIVRSRKSDGEIHMEACRMCNNAKIDKSLSSDNDYSACCIAYDERKKVRMMYCSGGCFPPSIDVDIWSDGMQQWCTCASYYPKYCPNCGRKITEYGKNG